MNDARILRDNDDIRKALWYLKQESLSAEDNSSLGGIGTNVTAKLRKWKEKVYVNTV